MAKGEHIPPQGYGKPAVRLPAPESARQRPQISYDIRKGIAFKTEAAHDAFQEIWADEIDRHVREAIASTVERLQIEIEGLDLLHLPEEWGDGWVRRSDVLALLTPAAPTLEHKWGWHTESGRIVTTGLADPGERLTMFCVNCHREYDSEVSREWPVCPAPAPTE